MKLWMLGSGSEGNALVVECDGERILIDVGFGPRILAARMRTAGIEPDTIGACFVTHEHTDHIQGLKKAVKRWGWPVFATAGTATTAALAGICPTIVEDGVMTNVGAMSVQPIATPHDATQSVGYVVTSQRSGARAAVFYDIGRVSPAIREACKDVDILVLESNHDAEMLRHGPYPAFLQSRISGGRGHLSNHGAAALVPEVVCADLRHVVLAHLSQHCNSPAVALETVGSALRRTRFRGRLTACVQHAVSGPFVADSARVRSTQQYELTM